MVIWLSFILTNILVKLSFQQNIDWCSKELQCVANGSMEHKNVLCGDDPVTANGTNTITDELRKFLLQKHNVFRNTHAGGMFEWSTPANIRQLTWDYTLEKMATRSAMRCTVAPDELECRKTPVYPVIGQNYQADENIREYDPPPQIEVLAHWNFTQYEVAKAHLTVTKLEDSYEAGPWSPAIRMMWADTVKMGCGVVACQHYSEENKTTVKDVVIVCNYAPGEQEKKPIYQRGNTCSGCSDGTACNPKSIYPKLCAAPGDPADDSLGPDPAPTTPPGPSTASGPSTAPGPTTASGPPTTAPGPTQSTIPPTVTNPHSPTTLPVPSPLSKTNSLMKRPWRQHLLIYLSWVFVFL